MDICELELSVRAYNGLYRQGIRTIEQLTQYSKKDLIKLRNMGPSSVENIDLNLKRCGYYLRGETEMTEKEKETLYKQDSVSEFERLNATINNLSRQLKALEENGNGYVRYAKQGYLDTHTGGFVSRKKHQIIYYDEMIKMVKGLFRKIDGSRYASQIRKVTDLRVEQAELGAKMLDDLIDVVNKYIPLTNELDEKLNAKFRGESND